MKNDKFLNKFNSLAALFSDWLTQDQGLNSSDSTLNRAIDHSLFAPGKRMRPVLALGSAEMLGVPLERLRSFCLALEYVHTFSLIHDDLPALDNDALRRGKPTCHVEFGEAAALLAGDKLSVRAFEVLVSDETIEAGQRLALLKLLSTASKDLCEGQMLDLESGPKFRGQSASGVLEEELEEQLKKRHLLKTAALIRAALLGPSQFLVPEKCAEVEESLSIFGERLGLLFQVTDDILDATKSSEALGKTSHSDGKDGTPTYVSVFGVERARSIANDLSNEAVEALSSFGPEADFMREFPEYIVIRSR